MIIGIDIDDTITHTSGLIFKYAKKHFQTHSNKKVRQILNASKIEGKLLDFYNMNLAEMMGRYKLKSKAKEVICRLKQKGHSLIIITARGHTIKKDLDKVTLDYFKKRSLKFDKLIFETADKADACLENKIDLMIDDSISTLQKIRDKGIKTVLFTSSHNQGIESDIDRVNNWLELEDYIDQLTKN